MKRTVVGLFCAYCSLSPTMARAEAPEAQREPAGPVRPYVVRHGDYVSKLADAFGVDADAIWNHPKNAELKHLRKPDTLQPGDILFVPSVAFASRSASAESAPKEAPKAQTSVIRILFEGRPSQAYVVSGTSAPVTGITDHAGQFVIELPVLLKQIQILFSKQNFSYPINIGMDSIDEPSGVRARLQNLGYLSEPSSGDTADEIEARDREAIRSFQRSKGHEPTGSADEATRAMLVKEHGS